MSDIREFTREYERQVHCLNQDLRDFFGFSEWLGQVRSCERYVRCLNQDLPDFIGFSGWLARVRSCERWMRVYERLRALRALSESGFAGFYWIFGMAGSGALV